MAGCIKITVYGVVVDYHLDPGYPAAAVGAGSGGLYQQLYGGIVDRIGNGYGWRYVVVKSSGDSFIAIHGNSAGSGAAAGATPAGKRPPRIRCGSKNNLISVDHRHYTAAYGAAVRSNGAGAGAVLAYGKFGGDTPGPYLRWVFAVAVAVGSLDLESVVARKQPAVALRSAATAPDVGVKAALEGCSRFRDKAECRRAAVVACRWFGGYYGDRWRSVQSNGGAVDLRPVAGVVFEFDINGFSAVARWERPGFAGGVGFFHSVVKVGVVGDHHPGYAAGVGGGKSQGDADI